MNQVGRAMTGEEVNHLIDLLVQLIQSSQPGSFGSIKELLNLISIPIPSVTVPKGKRLFRVRANSSVDDFFYKISDLHHRTDSQSIKQFGRANEPGQSIFYCSDSRKVAFIETSIITREQKNLPHQTLTTGVWEVQEDFRIATITENELIEGLNPTMSGLQISFNELVEKFRNTGTQAHLDLLNLISLEFTRKAIDSKRDYKLSCAFANYVYEQWIYDTFTKSTGHTNGIMYPSTLYRQEGVNLALLPSIIETGKLKLVEARKGTMVKKGNQYFEEDVKDCLDIDYTLGALKWN